MENDWTFVKEVNYAGQYFGIWIKPIKREDGSFMMLAKTKECTKRTIKGI